MDQLAKSNGTPNHLKPTKINFSSTKKSLNNSTRRSSADEQRESRIIEVILASDPDTNEYAIIHSNKSLDKLGKKVFSPLNPLPRPNTKAMPKKSLADFNQQDIRIAPYTEEFSFSQANKAEPTQKRYMPRPKAPFGDITNIINNRANMNFRMPFQKPKQLAPSKEDQENAYYNYQAHGLFNPNGSLNQGLRTQKASQRETSKNLPPKRQESRAGSTQQKNNASQNRAKSSSVTLTDVLKKFTMKRANLKEQKQKQPLINPRNVSHQRTKAHSRKPSNQFAFNRTEKNHSASENHWLMMSSIEEDSPHKAFSLNIDIEPSFESNQSVNSFDKLNHSRSVDISSKRDEQREGSLGKENDMIQNLRHIAKEKYLANLMTNKNQPKESSTCPESKKPSQKLENSTQQLASNEQEIEHEYMVEKLKLVASKLLEKTEANQQLLLDLKKENTIENQRLQELSQRLDKLILAQAFKPKRFTLNVSGISEQLNTDITTNCTTTNSVFCEKPSVEESSDIETLEKELQVLKEKLKKEQEDKKKLEVIFQIISAPQRQQTDLATPLAEKISVKEVISSQHQASEYDTRQSQISTDVFPRQSQASTDQLNQKEGQNDQVRQGRSFPKIRGLRSFSLSIDRSTDQ